MAAVDLTVAKLLLPLMVRLRAEGHTVEAACSDGPHARALRAQGWTVHAVPVPRSLHPLRAAHALAGLTRLLRRGRYAVVHVHTPVAAALGRAAARLARVPMVVYTAHGFYFHEGMRPWAYRAVAAAERALGRWTDLLLCQSGEDAESAVRLGIVPRQRVVWIGNGVDTARFAAAATPEARARARATLGLAPEARVVGFVGRLVREKGVLELLAAFARVRQGIPDARLLLVGDTLGSDRDRGTVAALRGLLEGHGLHGAVLFAGFREEVAEALAAMDVFALPSHREGMPRTILEAMAAGLPVVATAIRGCREEVVAGVTGELVPVGDAAVLADALARLLRDPALARRLGAAGRARARAEFDEGLVLERQVAAYRRLLAERAGRATPAAVGAGEERRGM